MAKSVFYSFHYDRDHWRVNMIRQIGALQGQVEKGAQEWEDVKRSGDAAVEKWIHDQMKYKEAVVVLIGPETADRKWVRYEIQKAWRDKRPLVGIYIHGLKDSDQKTAVRGKNPFELFEFSDSPRTFADYVPVYDPSGSDSKEVYSNIANNLSTWVASAYKQP